MYTNMYISERISPQWQQERRADAQPRHPSHWLRSLRSLRQAH